MILDTLCRDPSVSDADLRAAMAEMKNHPMTPHDLWLHRELTKAWRTNDPAS
jgi:hypothetical protein